MDGLTFYKELTGKTFPPEWTYQEVQSLPNVDHFYFWCTLPIRYQEHSEVPLRQVVGSTDERYNNVKKSSYSSCTWMDMLGSLERVKSNLRVFKANQKDFVGLQQFVAQDSIGSSGISYLRFGEEYLIDAGNHRTCFGKMLEGDYFKAQVNEYTFDTELYNIYHWLIHYGFEVDVEGYPNLVRKQNIDKVLANWNVSFQNCPVGKSRKIRIQLRNRQEVIDFANYYDLVKATKRKKLTLFTRQFNALLQKQVLTTQKDIDEIVALSRIDYIYSDLSKFKAEAELRLNKCNSTQIN